MEKLQILKTFLNYNMLHFPPPHKLVIDSNRKVFTLKLLVQDLQLLFLLLTFKTL